MKSEAKPDVCVVGLGYIGLPTAAIIARGGCFLVTRRLPGVHLEGCWEFPGGKCELDETLAACLAREIREELGVTIEVGSERLAVTHTYPERIVELHFFVCELKGEPRAMLGQEMRWVRREELDRLPFPPADAELIAELSGAA